MPVGIYRWPSQEIESLRPAGKAEDKGKLFAVCRDDAGVALGYATYSTEDMGRVGFTPNMKVKIEVFATRPVVQARLMQFLWEQDWVVAVEVETQPADDIWRLFLRNPRAAWQADRHDTLWVRIVDVPTALSTRTYVREGRLVLAVQDKDGYAEGVFALEGGPDGATCVSTTENPDLVVSVQALGSLPGRLYGLRPGQRGPGDREAPRSPGAGRRDVSDGGCAVRAYVVLRTGSEASLSLSLAGRESSES